MATIKKITDKQGNDIYLRTHTKAVVDDNGYTAESRLQAMQDEINQTQLAVGAVPSDLTPTEGSSNWVTSGGLYNATHIGNPNIEIDLNEYTAVRAFPSSTGKWTCTNDSYPYYGYFVPIKGKQRYIITSNISNKSSYAFLKDNSYAHSQVVNYATGASRVDLDANTTITITAPLDATYLYISQQWNGDWTPQSVIENNKKSVLEVLENIEETPTDNSKNLVNSGGVKKAIYDNSHLDTLPLTIDLNNYDSVNIWLTTESWVTTYTGKFIPVKAGSYYRVTANAQNDSYCCFTLNNNGTPYLGSGSSRETISANTATTLKAPFDAMFLWISDTASSVRLPQSVEEFDSTYILDKLPLFNEMPNTIDLSNYRAINIGPNGSNKWQKQTGWYGKFIYIKGYKHIFLQAGINNALFCLLTEGGYKGGQAVSYVDGYEKNGKKIYANTWEIIDIPDDALYLYYFVTTNNYTTNGEPSKVILLNELVHRDELSSIIEGNNSFPTYIKFGENEGVMYTIDNFIMKHIYDNDVEYLFFSKDLGKNWVQVENTFDAKITHAHYFIDGTLLMCTPTKCYWTKDFQTFTESTVYDYDGSIFQPTSGTRFYTIPKYKEKRTMVNNEEWHLWGDYIISTTKPRLWYTKDNGRTIHAAYAFGLSNIDGTVYNARHIHAFEYNPYDGYFYAFTGDSSTECHIIKGQYDNDTWNWEHIATGALWKLTSPVFFNGYFAAVTDYTDSSLAEKKGLVRCPTNAITEENICYLFNATSSMMGSAALSGYIYDKNGWRVMSTDYLGSNKVLIAKNNYDFVWVDNDDGKRISSFIGPNANGDVYAKFGDVGASTSGETWLKINGDSFNFTKAMRGAGAKDFFNYRITDF